MTTPITYSLKAGDKTSDQFYSELAAFTDIVIQAGKEQLEELVSGFEDAHPGESTHPELIFDLLVIGVLWHVYGTDALTQSPTRQWVLAKLADFRQNARWTRPFIDPIRGLLSQDLIRPGNSNPPP